MSAVFIAWPFSTLSNFRKLHFGLIFIETIQSILFELNFRKHKWLVISMYRSSFQDSKYLLNSLSIILDHFRKTFDCATGLREKHFQCSS